MIIPSNRQNNPLPSRSAAHTIPAAQARPTASHLASEPSIARLPSRIWTTPTWRPPPPNLTTHGLYSIDDVARYLHSHSFVPGDPESKLTITGHNIMDLALKYRQEIGTAVLNNDFSTILSPDREFVM